jgi:uroporphyrin-3 C-methyltransferase
MSQLESPRELTEATPPPAMAHSPRRNLLADWIARMSIMQMTAIVVMLVFLWQWFDMHHQIGTMQQEVTRRLAEMAKDNQATQLLAKQQQEAVRELSAKQALLEARFAEIQDQRMALEALYNELSASRDEMALADVEQLLLIAAQQLQLSANVKAALIAIQNADARLQRMDRPAFNGLRRAINQDMEKLRALPSLDVAGMSQQISELMQAADSLPLSYQQRVARKAPEPVLPKDATVWQKLWSHIWQEVRQLVRIRDTGQMEIPLLPPEQEFFLRENLKLHLMSARLALLARDQGSFRQEFQGMQFWIRRYFDITSDEGAAALGALNKLAAASINVELPDISASLQAVRSYRLARENENHTGPSGRKDAP